MSSLPWRLLPPFTSQCMCEEKLRQRFFNGGTEIFLTSAIAIARAFAPRERASARPMQPRRRGGRGVALRTEDLEGQPVTCRTLTWYLILEPSSPRLCSARSAPPRLHFFSGARDNAQHS